MATIPPTPAMRISTSATAAVLAALSDEDEDSASTFDDDSVSLASSLDEPSNGCEGSPSYATTTKSRRVQYALFPLPPSSSCPFTSPNHRHHLSSLSTNTTRSSTPVSSAFSPNEPPRIPLPELPDTPSPLLLLSHQHSRPGSNATSHISHFPCRSASSNDNWEEQISLSRSSVNTLSHLPYLSNTSFREKHTRDSTIRPFEEKLSLPPSPIHLHEFNDISFTLSSAQSRTNTPSLALEPPLPIEPRSISPSSVPPKSPSVTSLQHFDEMLSIALETIAADTSTSSIMSGPAFSHPTSGSTSRAGSVYSSPEAHVSSHLPEHDEQLTHVLHTKETWSRNSSEASLDLRHLESRERKIANSKKQSKIVFDDCSSSDEEAFDLSLDVDTRRHNGMKRRGDIEEEEEEEHVILQEIDIHQLSSYHRYDDSSLSSSSECTSQRDSLATNTSQASSAGTSAACIYPSLEETKDLKATFEQGLGITSPGIKGNRLLPKDRIDMRGLVPSTPWATSLVMIRPPRESSLPRRIVESDEQASSAIFQKDVLPACAPNIQQNIMRSKLPSFGFSNSRRPSETPSCASSHDSTMSSDQTSPTFNNASNLRSKPISTSSSSSLTNYTMNKLRNVRSTPLLRRKISSQLPIEESNGGNDKNVGSSIHHSHDIMLGLRKGSLPEVPPKRIESGIRSRASFLPTSMRRGN